MSKENNGGSAFPVDGTSAYMRSEGITVRDYFAGKAMEQFLAGSVIPAAYDATAAFRAVAGRAYEAADAMLYARQF